MDEMNYNDTELDNYLSRFGDNEPRKKVTPLKATTEGMKPIENISAGAGNNLDAKPTKIETSKGEGLLSGVDAGGYMEIATGGLDLANMARGKQYDTSADGGGIMSSEAAITKGAVTGAQMGKALGPWGMAAGAVVGGVIGGVSRGAAAREYGENIATKNLKDDRIEKVENAETYRMEQGQESLGLLKGLRQKQLGIQNT